LLHRFSLSCAAADSQFEKEAAELGKSCEYCSIIPMPSTTGGGEDFQFATNCGLLPAFLPVVLHVSRYLSCSLYTACPLSSADPQPSSTHGFLTNLRPSESEVSPSTLLFGSSRPPSTTYVPCLFSGHLSPAGHRHRRSRSPRFHQEHDYRYIVS
jgi:hypothetical protein